MTREEAKAILYEWQEMMVRNGVPLDTSKVQALRVAIESLQAEMIPKHDVEIIIEEITKRTSPTDGDLISKADAIEAVMNTEPTVFDAQSLEPHQKTKDVIDALTALPSAEAEPTVIRSRTFMRAEDFEKWAERIREVNPNAIVIPCDAEVVSAEDVRGADMRGGEDE